MGAPQVPISCGPETAFQRGSRLARRHRRSDLRGTARMALLPDLGDMAIQPCRAPVMVRVTQTADRLPDRFSESLVGGVTAVPEALQGDCARSARLYLGRELE